MDLPLTGLTVDELAAHLPVDGRPSAPRARALFRWLYQGGARSLPAALPDRIDGLSHRALAPVRGRLRLPDLRLTEAQASEDGTTKLLLDAGAAPLETVVIPTLRRTTVCVSSPSGCARGCLFCATAQMGLGRNLRADEIVAQVLLATGWAPASAPVRNVVFMGMGEPMDNLDEVLRAIDVLTEPAGMGLARRHITVSSVGVIPQMERFMTDGRACLAISLHAPTDAQRGAIMPVNRRWPVAELAAFIGRWATPDRPILIQYTMIAGFNDRDEDADRLAELLGGLAVRINLIPVNPHPGSPYGRPDGQRVAGFHARVLALGMPVWVRTTRGDEIAAACGQLHRGEVSTPRRMGLGRPAPG